MLEVKQVYKQYQQLPLLEGITFIVKKKETICILGPSGGGKSTLLRIIAGLEQPDSGKIIWRGVDITDQPAHLRRFGFMFQDYALFPHMNVQENVAFGLQMQKLGQQEITQRVGEALEMVHMERFISRRVTDLSGGEQQRVALARTLAPRPNMLMLDEPLGALDRTLRAQLSAELRNLLHQIDIPVIYVTHDQDEAFSIADRVAILNQGHIIQSGTPAEVYTRPQSLWLASFLGLENRVRGRVEDAHPLRVRTDLGIFQCECAREQLDVGDDVTLVLRPTGAQPANGPSNLNVIDGKVMDAVYSADRYKVSIQFSKDHTFSFFLNSPHEVHGDIRLSILPEAILCYRDA